MVFALFLLFILATIFMTEVDYNIKICVSSSIPLAGILKDGRNISRVYIEA